MELLINGMKKEFSSDNIVELINKLGLHVDAVAVELNKEIVHREKFNSTKLKDGDRLEIVKVVGGG